MGFSLAEPGADHLQRFFFVTLKPWDERKKPEEQYAAIRAQPQRANCAKLPEASAFAFPPPAIPGVGTAGGFTFMLEDRAGPGPGVPDRQPRQVHGRRAQAARTGQCYPPRYLPSVPQIYVKVDRDKVLKQGVDLGDVYRTLQTFMGGYFVNYFNRFGRQWQVYVEAEGEYRATRREHRPVLRAQQSAARACRFPPLPTVRTPHRAGVHHALQ